MITKHSTMKLASVTIAVLAVLALPDAQAQSLHRFTEALYIEVPYNYGREAVYTDELLWHYHRGSLAAPAPGQALEGRTAGEGAAVWSPVTADTSGFFRPQPGAGGNLNSPNNPAGPGRIDRQSSQTPRTPQRWRPGPSYIYTTYRSPKAQSAVLNIRGNSAVLVNGELHAGDPYRLGWMAIPVHLKKGLNEFYIRGLFVAAELHFPESEVYVDPTDATLPDIVEGKDNSQLMAGLVVVNTTSKPLVNLSVSSTVQGKTVSAAVPAILPYSSRKVAVPIDGSGITQTGDVPCLITLKGPGRAVHEQPITLRSVSAATPYRVTFISDIDGSVQYYAVNPASTGEKPGDALFFSVHGAGVEALGQAQAYTAKDWGTLVAPTNRRPRGFNWEDWGRLDALEVLNLARQSLRPDTQRIYLTGHSMGGHGTWFLGATYPDKWAAIAPCAGYPTLKGYGSADGLIPDKGRNALEDMLLRASNQSDVIAYASNYKPLGIYILHGDADRTVPVEYARQMRKVLGDFHPNFAYYEYLGGSHWYSNESVDWKPLFDYFQWHRRNVDTAVHHIDFTTANPGISAAYYWASIHQQQEPLNYSRIVLDRDVKMGTISGKTENVGLLRLDIGAFAPGQPVRIRLDSLNEISYQRPEASLLYLRREANSWRITEPPARAEKGPHRNGSFKEAFNHRMVYVYATRGTDEENRWALEKARYDAESWYYRGNGAFDIVADTEFDPAVYANCNVILVGNASTNGAWHSLLSDCPIRVERSGVRIGSRYHQGDDLGGYFSWKKPGSDHLSVGVITGTGIKGMRAAAANQYFAGASGFPDYLFFAFDMLKHGSNHVVDAGYYTNQWEINQ
ncbi:Esterase PHB depolymerase [Parapedobacter composti]|uniref:Esterase PHB depolymerase n=2 Tax=Parapedobacter composti TaxID=623281 RepID=A0A1I1E6C1_9SPHI|nr:Esterase PHB depolymerase [Parapedobacter composti]